MFKNITNITMGDQQPSTLTGEGSTTRELCPVDCKLLAVEAHSTLNKGEDIVCSALRDAGVAI